MDVKIEAQGNEWYRIISEDDAKERNHYGLNETISAAIFLAGPRDSILFNGEKYTPKTILNVMPKKNTLSSAARRRNGKG